MKEGGFNVLEPLSCAFPALCFFTVKRLCSMLQVGQISKSTHIHKNLHSIVPSEKGKLSNLKFACPQDAVETIRGLRLAALNTITDASLLCQISLIM